MGFLKDKQTRRDFITYALVIVAFVVVQLLVGARMIPRSIQGQLVPITAYVVMAVALNLVVGIAGDLSLGHAGFMSVGAFSGVVVTMSLSESIPSEPARLAIAIAVGAVCAAIMGFLIGLPVMRLQGDYLAIVTLAFGEIIKELINCLIIGYDENGLHFIFNPAGNKTVDDLGLSDTGIAIIKGAQGATGTATIATFTAGFILVMLTLIVVLNLTRSRAGRAIMAIRDNHIAAQSIGLNLTKYKLMAFVTSAALAGAAGALYGLNYSSLQATKFNFDPHPRVRGARRPRQYLGLAHRRCGADDPARGAASVRRLPHAHLRDRADLRHARDQQSAGQGVYPEASAPSPCQC